MFWGEAEGGFCSAMRGQTLPQAALGRTGHGADAITGALWQQRGLVQCPYKKLLQMEMNYLRSIGKH